MTLSAEMGTLLVISQVRTVDARFVHHDGSDLKALIRDAAKEFIASSRVQCAYANAKARFNARTRTAKRPQTTGSRSQAAAAS